MDMDEQMDWAGEEMDQMSGSHAFQPKPPSLDPAKMDAQITRSTLHEDLGQTQDKMNKTNNSSAEVPAKIVTYINDHGLNAVVKKAINKTVRELPHEPIGFIAQELVKASKKSYPIFDSFSARKVILNDNLLQPSLEIGVSLSYQGRTKLRHRLTYTFDEANAHQFLLETKEDVLTLGPSLDFVNKVASEKLKD